MRSLTTFLATALLVINSLSLLADETPANQLASSTDAALQALARNFFEGRRSQQPAQGDDIPRVERPDGWRPDF